jgi:hypothetical protein
MSDWYQFTEAECALLDEAVQTIMTVRTACRCAIPARTISAHDVGAEASSGELPLSSCSAQSSL